MFKKKNQNLNLLSRNYRGYLKNHWTNTSLVCTHLNIIFMLNSNMAIKIWFSKNCGKSWKVLAICLLSTPAWGRSTLSFWDKSRVSPKTVLAIIIAKVNFVNLVSVVLWLVLFSTSFTLSSLKSKSHVFYLLCGFWSRYSTFIKRL